MTYSENFVLLDVFKSDAQIRVSDKNLCHKVFCNCIHQRTIVWLAMQNSVINEFRVAVMEWGNSKWLERIFTH